MPIDQTFKNTIINIACLHHLRIKIINNRKPRNHKGKGVISYFKKALIFAVFFL